MTEYDDLRALFVNCTLKRSPAVSNTEGLIDVSRKIMEKQGVQVDVVRAIDHDIATGVWPDMTEHGWATDEWPAIQEQVIERLYGNSSILNEGGQYPYYGRVGGCLITGNEDGVKHCAMNILYSLQHLGYTIPPQAEQLVRLDAAAGPVVRVHHGECGRGRSEHLTGGVRGGDGCEIYVEQIRRTFVEVGQVEPENLSEETRDRLMNAFRTFPRR